MSLTFDFDSESETYDVEAISYKKIENKITKLGYADGKSDGNDAGVEKGFRHGFTDGLLTGFHLAKYKTFYATMNSKKKENTALTDEHKVYEKLEVPAPMDKTHYQSDQFKDLSLEQMSRRQHKYIRKKLDEFELKLPLATNLLVADGNFLYTQNN
ncbi:uncharacterized protein LOC119678565 [Teleopsis dalmanni]|uniref:uncharacterized protein LOC119678565 n=1 Tax=Teleopsis dalmanni TaxID=139649 RepID=UPI0018CF80AA|nr:uncharacterized protein LOC119678565 [Teleopsis dalmanni]